LRTAWAGALRAADAGRRVTVCGWVAARRDHGEHLVFVDVRDRTGLVQCVIDGGPTLRVEYVVAVEGTVRRRPAGTENPTLPSGEVELADCRVEVLAEAEPPPFPLSERADTAGPEMDRPEVDESVRLRYRYLDLRRSRMQANLRLRARVNAALRQALDRLGFLEVETPLLWTPTPEGAREFAVPSRLQPGSFYVLPQSPQIAKQLLMVAGFDRYYQIARCLRDEDLRADRQFEFTQLDLEASFATQEDVMGWVSEAVREATEAAVGVRPPSMGRMTWTEAMERYGTDKPDLRFGMELCELTELLAGTGVAALQAPCVKGFRVPGQGGLSRARLDGLTERARRLGAKGLAWFRTVPAGPDPSATEPSATDPSGAGSPAGSPSPGGATAAPVGLDGPLARHLAPAEVGALAGALGLEVGDLALVVADDRPVARSVLGQLRLELGRPPVGEGPLSYVWVVDFPLFEGLDDEGRPVAAHHPFTMPAAEDLDRLTSDPLSVRAQAYDLVLNGWELGSGSIRIHRADIQRQVFDTLGLSPEVAEARFGFLLGAFRYGAPPHGGFAFGIDRLAAVLAREENIREVIAFPKSQSGADLMTGAPKALSERALAELRLRPLPADPR
jgi:aspartyl-tRNA synthetase